MACMSQTLPIVQIDHLTKRYRRAVAVDALSLDVPEGATVGFLGINGAGKTTMMELVAGLRRPDAGSVRVAGLDPVQDRRQLRQLLGVQLQKAELHSALSARTLARLYASFYPQPLDPDEALSLVQLTDQADTRFEHLSGGQAQRLSVALAMIGRPRVLILDEMSTGLDPAARRRMWAVIEHLQSQGATILLVSHAMDEVEHLCDRIVLLDRGRIVQDGTARDVMAASGTTTLDEAFLALTGAAAGEGQESGA